MGVSGAWWGVSSAWWGVSGAWWRVSDAWWGVSGTWWGVPGACWRVSGRWDVRWWGGWWRRIPLGRLWTVVNWNAFASVLCMIRRAEAAFLALIAFHRVLAVLIVSTSGGAAAVIVFPVFRTLLINEFLGRAEIE